MAPSLADVLNCRKLELFFPLKLSSFNTHLAETKDATHLLLSSYISIGLRQTSSTVAARAEPLTLCINA